MLLFYLSIFMVGAKSLLIKIAFRFRKPLFPSKVIYCISFVHNTFNEISVLIRIHECQNLRNPINNFSIESNLLKNLILYKFFKRVP